MLQVRIRACPSVSKLRYVSICKDTISLHVFMLLRIKIENEKGLHTRDRISKLSIHGNCGIGG